MKNGYYFIVVCWGERYRNYFLDYCLPSLLAPGNIPALENKAKSRFLICTTDEDHGAMYNHRSIIALSQHIDPIFIDIPPCPPDKSGCQHMGVGHRIASNFAHSKRACAMFLQPDTLISDGAIVRLQQLHDQGRRLIVCPAIRFDEKRLIANLGIIKAPRLTLGARNLAESAIAALHPETAAYRWDAPYATTIFPIVWWRRDGAMLLHCISWEPLLVDYAEIDDHDVSTFDHWTIDGDYLSRNWEKVKDKIYVVRSSDEICFVGFTPTHEGPQWPYVSLLRWAPLREWVRRGQIRRMFASVLVDDFKREMFRLPMAFGGPLPEEDNFEFCSVVADALAGPRRGDWVHVLAEIFILAWVAKGRIAMRIMRAMAGDKRAMRDLGYAARYTWRQIWA